MKTMIRNHKKFFHLIHHHQGYLTSKIHTSVTQTCKQSSDPPCSSPPTNDTNSSKQHDDTSESGDKRIPKLVSKNHHHIDHDEFNRIVKKWKHSLGMETPLYKSIRDSAVFSLNQFNKIMDKIVDEAMKQEPKVCRTINHAIQDCSAKLKKTSPGLVNQAAKMNDALDKLFMRLCGGLNKNDSRVNEVREDLKTLSIGAIERAIQAAKDLQAKIDAKKSSHHSSRK